MKLDDKVILPNQTIGIIGGGQLGRMMALAAKAQGFRIAVLDPAADSPCAQVADVEIIADYNDLEAIAQLARVSDVITYEFENVDVETLSWLCENANVPQGKKLLKITQNRISEKAAIMAAGLKVAPYAVCATLEEVYDKIETLGLPAVLKTARGGYDGKGQAVIRSITDIPAASKLLESGPCVLESWLTFEKELSVIVTRKSNGEMTTFPVAENVHEDNILHLTIVPARISVMTEDSAVTMARTLAEKLEVVGTLAIEMFLTHNDELFINELAPRPHNSGHFTIEACETSQFEQHIRAISNWQLGSTQLLKPAVMVNLLGEHMERLLTEIPQLEDWKIHLYGKMEARAKRKMGHVTILANSTETVLAEIENHPIWSNAKEKIGGTS
ncbi:MAG: 5-(carboxyamino)imidazole ribonucleotide synthase [Bacillota bacterium]|nr:5-(carboxyamino)imidazole ribonucleotide synthase [Bacillota bacterium]